MNSSAAASTIRRRVARVRAARGLTPSLIRWSLTLELNYSETGGAMAGISGIHHVKLRVSDIAASRAWYERVLGFAVEIEFEEDSVVRPVRHCRDGFGLALR